MTVDVVSKTRCPSIQYEFMYHVLSYLETTVKINKPRDDLKPCKLDLVNKI